VNETDEQRTRELLHDAVADVEPASGLDAIRARTSAPDRSRWVWPAVAVAAGVAVLVGAMTVLGGRDDDSTSRPPASRPSAVAHPTPSAPTPATPPSTASSEPTAAAQGVVVPVYYVGDTSHGPRLFREFHRVTANDPVLAAAQLAVQGNADDLDYRTLWPKGTRVVGVSFDGVGNDGAAQVRLDGAQLDHLPPGMTDRDARLALQQVVWTVNGVLQASPGYHWYLGRGHDETTPWGQASSSGAAALAADDVLAQVQVDDPVDGSTVGSSFTVRGRAAAFEATVVWELVKDDVVVRQGSGMAHECCTLSPYSFRIRNVPPGDYVLVVHDEDASGGEGGPPWTDTKRITVE
jgi:hypothetical protein